MYSLIFDDGITGDGRIAGKDVDSPSVMSFAITDGKSLQGRAVPSGYGHHRIFFAPIDDGGSDNGWVIGSAAL